MVISVRFKADSDWSVNAHNHLTHQLIHHISCITGIANSLDLTDRILPRLTTHTRCKPRLLHFPPYSREEIATILIERVRGEGVSGERGKEVVMERAAVEFCARKVSAVHGDLRKALDICR